MFSERFSFQYGYYTVNFFDKGYFREIVIDDKIPCDLIKRTPLFLQPVKGNLGPLILEKAYAKYSRCYYNFHKLPERLCNSIFYLLTGFVSQRIAISDLTNKSENLKFKQMLLKFKDFKVRIAYLHKEVALKLGFNPNHPYILQDIFKSDGEPVFVFKTIHGE